MADTAANPFSVGLLYVMSLYPLSFSSNRVTAGIKSDETARQPRKVGASRWRLLIGLVRRLSMRSGIRFVDAELLVAAGLNGRYGRKAI